MVCPCCAEPNCCCQDSGYVRKKNNGIPTNSNGEPYDEYPYESGCDGTAFHSEEYVDLSGLTFTVEWYGLTYTNLGFQERGQGGIPFRTGVWRMITDFLAETVYGNIDPVENFTFDGALYEWNSKAMSIGAIATGWCGKKSIQVSIELTVSGPGCYTTKVYKYVTSDCSGSPESMSLDYDWYSCFFPDSSTQAQINARMPDPANAVPVVTVSFAP